MKKLLALFVALTLMLVNVAAMAETTTLKAGTSPDFPPFESMDDAGNVVGFDADLALSRNERALWSHAQSLLPSVDIDSAMPRT